MDMRKCRKCDSVLSLSAFRYDKGKPTWQCLTCYHNQLKKWRDSNKEYSTLKKKEWYEANKEHVIAKAKVHCYRYRKNNNTRIAHCLRTRLKSVLKGKVKRGSAVRDLGCSIDELKTHLESMWQPGMTWENHGVHCWHIDHIYPLSKSDLVNPEELRKACHYTNLQPLWWQDNIAKGARL